MVHCKNCGTEISENDKFCKECGKASRPVLISKHIKKEPKSLWKSIEPYYLQFIAFPLALSIVLGFTLEVFNKGFEYPPSQGADILLILYIGISMILIVLPAIMSKFKNSVESR